nr:ABC transporter ATP-binding protein [Inediibacterium massiliense]
MNDSKSHIDLKEIVIDMKKITKKFGNFVANDSIDLKVHKGEVHALLGENGAGKSTLMNILYGLYTPTSGEIYIKGEKVDVKNPNVAIHHGIGMVHQHFMLIKPFTVAENIVLGMEPINSFHELDMKKAIEDVEKISKRYGLYVDPRAKIEDISVSMQQRVEILKALYRGAEILILDEPTAVLTPQEIKELIQIMRNLTKQGKSIILITHKLKEIKESADFCTIIRRGKKIDRVEVSKTDENQLAAMMVGREVNFKVSKEEKIPGKVILEIKDLIVEDNRGISTVNGLNLFVQAGEVLGIAGVDGNGQTELIETITGLRKAKFGQILIGDKDITNKTPREVFESGISNIPEDRQKHGLVLDFTVYENMILENFRKEPFSRGVKLQKDNIINFSKKLMEEFDIRPRNEKNLARSLSGGNQQKVIIAREVTNDPELLIAVQPTRGLDVGAIEFVHKSLIDQRNKNKAVLLVSFELDEVMSVSDRIAVIYEGKIVGIVDAKRTNENELGLMMAGGGHK